MVTDPWEDIRQDSERLERTVAWMLCTVFLALVGLLFTITYFGVKLLNL